MSFTRFATRLGNRERTAREALDRGCTADLEWTDCLITRHVRKARVELADRVLSLGVDPVLRRAAIAIEAEDVAAHCVRDVFANADIRFRARFRTYAESLPGRKIRIPHLDLAAQGSIVPRAAAVAPFEEWLGELETAVRAALREAIESARHVLVRRAVASLARARASFTLAVAKR